MTDPAAHLARTVPVLEFLQAQTAVSTPMDSSCRRSTRTGQRPPGRAERGHVELRRALPASCLGHAAPPTRDTENTDVDAPGCLIEQVRFQINCPSVMEMTLVGYTRHHRQAVFDDRRNAVREPPVPRPGELVFSLSFIASRLHWPLQSPPVRVNHAIHSLFTFGF